ncbi:MAG: Ig-like domain-containing protein, partial [Propionibacteriaceae bacterium]|nr:Ig-like domain-containing protein [Propionibacteriaceae bacterium]
MTDSKTWPGAYLDATKVAATGPTNSNIKTVDLTQYDETIAWFLPDATEEPVPTEDLTMTSSYMAGLDNRTDSNGYVTIPVDAPAAGAYTVHLLVRDSGLDDLRYELTVNGSSQGTTTTIGDSKTYGTTANGSTDTGTLSVISGEVQLVEGANTIKVQAPLGENGPALYAAAVVGDTPVYQPISTVLRSGEVGVSANISRSGKVHPVDTTGYGDLQNWDADTVGLFMPEANGSPIVHSRVAGLNRQLNNIAMRGHVSLYVDAPSAGEYDLSLLAAVTGADQRYVVTVNDEVQGTTEAGSQDTSSSEVYSTSASVAVNVLPMKVTLQEGENIITLNAVAGGMAPSFMAAKLKVDEVLVTSVVVAPSAGEITTEGGSLQMTASVGPSNATDKSVEWSIKPGFGDDLASIDPVTGLLTANGSADGTVTVVAMAKDGSGVTDEVTVTLSGQNAPVNLVVGAVCSASATRSAG